MKNIYKIFLTIVLVNLVFAQNEAGGMAGAYLRMPADARAAAMGNSATTFSNDVNANIANPANIPSIETRQFASSFQFLSLDRSYQSLSYGVNLPPSAGMSISWVHAGVDDIVGRTYANEPSSTYSWSQNAFIIGFGMAVVDWLSIGVSAKVLSEQLANSSSSGFSADIGLKINPIEDLSLAIVAKDVTGKSTWDISQESFVDYQTRRVDRFPLAFHFGASYMLLDKVLFTGVYKYSAQIEPSWHLGVEGKIANMLYLRGGLDNGAVTFGLGTSYKVWQNISTRMDYAFLPGMVDQGGSHLFTWLFFF
ncbi:MAG: hypothetical protein WCT23_01235 [Candidatus Neomarinimicrobiota bacterium]|jgi:opacity protein-like surface antigen